MLYNKPHDVRYVDMCIWIDQNAYKEGVDETQFFQYLYHICYMLAYKSKYFNSSKEYDDFSVFVATKLYFRYKSNKEQLPKIKSILNYSKRILYPYKVQFQQQEYKENVLRDEEQEEEFIIDNSFRLGIEDHINDLNRKDFELYLFNFHKTVKHFVDKTPYRKTSVDYRNIYISCMLTIINSMTHSHKDMGHLNNITRSDKIRENLYDKMYQTMSSQVVLYHLDETYSDYIKVLVNQVKASARQELRELAYSDTYTDDIINDVYTLVTNKSMEYGNE